MTLPQSMDSEKALLSCMILAPEKVVGEFVETGSEDLFYSHPHRVIYRHIVQLWASRSLVDLITLTQALEDSGALEQVGGAAYITDVSIFIPSASGWKHYVDIMRSKWVARESYLTAQKISEAALNPAADHTLQGIVQQGLVKITSMFESKAKSHNMGDLIMRALDRYEKNHESGGKINGILTGIVPLDKAVRGLQAGQMVTIAAPTKSGKSALALNIAMYNALKKVPTAVFSMEMNSDELTDRLISSHSEVDMGKMVAGGFDENDIQRLVRAGSELSGAPLFIRDEAVMSPLQFRAAARKMHAQHGCKLMVVDYLQLMDPGTGSDDNRERQVAQCSRTIKTTAAELGIPIIVLAQLNDFGRSRESRAIEQDSNLFVVIEEDKNGDPDEMVINIKHARSCPSARIPVTFRREIVKFEASEAQ